MNKELMFVERIKKMNETFKLPSNNRPTDQGQNRLNQFRAVLKDELDELRDVYQRPGGPPDIV